jgi:hypothetical protein
MFKELNQILKFFSPPCLLLDVEMNILLVNKSAERILGVQQVSGKPLADVIGQGGVKSIADELKKLLERAAPFEKNIKAGDVTARFTMCPVLNSQRETVAVLALVSDLLESTGMASAYFIDDLKNASDKLAWLVRKVEDTKNAYTEKLKAGAKPEKADGVELPTSKNQQKEYQKGTTASKPRLPEDINIGQLLQLLVMSIEPKVRGNGLMIKHSIAAVSAHVRGIKDDFAEIFAEALNFLVETGAENDLIYMKLSAPDGKDAQAGNITISLARAGSNQGDDVHDGTMESAAEDTRQLGVLRRIKELVEINAGKMNAIGVKDRGICITVHFRAQN